jgi:glycosyltransferase involved in cell wall biosynthesis
MRLFYVASIDNKVDGVNKKILAQFKVLSEMIFDSELILFIKGAPSNELRDQLNYLQSAQIEIVDTSSFGRLLARRTKMELLMKKAKVVSGNGFFYFRYPLADRAFLKVIKAIKKGGGMAVTEHQSIESRELLSNRRFVLFLIEFLYAKRVRKEMSGFVCVTREIADHQLARSGNYRKPYLINGNGIYVSSVPLRTPPKFDGRSLDLLCVAQVAKWHGLDRLIRGMAEYKGNVDVRLHIVGDGSELVNLKKLVTDLKLGDSVFFHGFKTGKELDAFFDKCHIAVGSVGAHRKGVTETSELKAREYCARGIPFFCSVPDADFPEDFPYALRVPSVEETIDMNKILTFVKSVCCDQRHPHIMREYALENLDWSIKMKRLVGFLERIISSSR